MMVGNSLRSDVIPAIETGAWGVYVPHDLTWALEHAEPPTDHPTVSHPAEPRHAVRARGAPLGLDLYLVSST